MKNEYYKLILISTIIVIILHLIACVYINIPVDKSHLLGDDYRLFQGTPAWDLAKAVKNQNVRLIRYYVKELDVPVDFKEEKFGETLLIQAVRTNKKKSVETLLSLGADPNIHDDTVGMVGRTSVYYASFFSRPSSDILELLLQYGGNPNSTECGYWIDLAGKKHEARNFALDAATSNSLEKVKLLIEYGADVNKRTSSCPNGAISGAIIHDRMDILLYLLEHGADAHLQFQKRDFDTPNRDIFYVDILYELRFCVYPLDSQEYKDKLKVIAFLKQEGLDYWSSPIPKNAFVIIKQKMKANRIKDNFDDYIKKY